MDEYIPPQGFGLDIAKCILFTVYSIIKNRLNIQRIPPKDPRAPDYDKYVKDRVAQYNAIHNAIVDLAMWKHNSDPRKYPEKNYQMTLSHLFGVTKTSGSGPNELMRDKLGLDLANLRNLFPTLSDDQINSFKNKSGIRIKFANSEKFAIIAITAKKPREAVDTPLYHLSMPHNPQDTRFSDVQLTIHFTDEDVSESGQYHEFHPFDADAVNVEEATKQFGELGDRGRGNPCGGGGGGSSSSALTGTALTASSASSSTTASASTRQGQGQGIGPSARSGPQQNVSITTGKYAGTYTFSCKGMDGSKPVNLYTRDGGTSDLYIVFKQAGKWFANPTTLTCGGGGSSANPNPGGKRRRSTRRKPRRALRKTRKAYI